MGRISKKPVSGDIQKPHGHLKGERVSQMTYKVKVNTKAGEGVKNTQKFDYVVYGWPLGPQVLRS